MPTLSGEMPGCFASFFSARCRIVKCDVSMPPSSACSQLHSSFTLLTARCVGCIWVHSNFGGAGLRLGRAHIGPDHAAHLVGRIGSRLDLRAELARLVHLIDALPGHVELPAVIDA